MAITNFVPEVWASRILMKLRASLVFGQSGVINRDYEGEIAEAGDTVHITAFNDPTVAPYVKNSTSISYEVLTDVGDTLVVDQSNYFAFKVDDIDSRQAKSGFRDSVSQGGGYKLAATADTYISTAMSNAVPEGNTLDPVSINVSSNASTAAAAAYETLVRLRAALRDDETPDEGRWCVVSPEFYSVLLLDPRFVSADAAGTTAGLRNGQVGRAAGFDVIESTRAPANTVLAGHAMATTYAEQITKVEAVRLESAFADGLRGLHLFGAKVIRPEQLAKVAATVTGVLPDEES